jgi:hypothetical protein
VTGTAVRAKGCPALRRPFITELSGQDFAKLLVDGWVPAGIALGISVAGLHDDLLTTSSGSWGTRNAEVPTYTDLMVYVRQDARRRLPAQGSPATEPCCRATQRPCRQASALTGIGGIGSQPAGSRRHRAPYACPLRADGAVNHTQTDSG